jgi:hypothetical protein
MHRQDDPAVDQVYGIKLRGANDRRVRIWENARGSKNRAEGEVE